MKQIHWVIDNGHGGLINGEYVTAPSKMFVFPDGLTIYEGVINRMIAGRLSELLTADDIPHTMLVSGNDDTSLLTRRRTANTLHLQHDRNTVLVSIHCNAGGGTGFEVFTTRGETKSDEIATVFMSEIANEFPEFRNRGCKESNFSILKCYQPAVLTENLFMDTRRDAEMLSTSEGVERIAMAHYQSIKKLDKRFNSIDEI